MPALSSLGGVDMTSVPRLLKSYNGLLSSGQGQFQFPFTPTGPVVYNSGTAHSGAFGFDPANYALTGKTLQVRIAGHVVTMTTDAASYNLSLRPVTYVNSGALTLGSITTQTGVLGGTSATPVAGAGSWITPPAAGFFVLCIEITVASSTSQMSAEARLEAKYI